MKRMEEVEKWLYEKYGRREEIDIDGKQDKVKSLTPRGYEFYFTLFIVKGLDEEDVEKVKDKVDGLYTYKHYNDVGYKYLEDEGIMFIGYEPIKTTIRKYAEEYEEYL